ncbi:MAG TPA: S41 family peptidase [Polyangiaceae bacterium]
MISRTPRAHFRKSLRRFSSLTRLLLVAAACVGSRHAAATTERQNPYAMFDQLGRVLSFVENEYVDPVDQQRLVEGALEGLVGKLDPHSAYLPAEDYAIFTADTEGRFGGVGVEVDFLDEWVTVIAPIEGSPAERAGVRPGDRILAIDHVPVRGKSPADLVRRMRGPSGTKVLLTVRRTGNEKYLYFTLTREIIDVASVASRLLARNIGYLRIKAFQVGTHTELLKHLGALRRSAKGELHGTILDLRNNPGGLVDEATQVADEFLTRGILFTTRRRDRIVDSVSALPGGALRTGPVVVLVNEYTASSAELVSGALQDHRRASIVGAPTFGKGSVQSIVDLPDGAGLRLTTLRYYTPSGRAIQAQGVKPDVLIATGGEFGVVREKNLEGHLAAEPQAVTETPQPGIDVPPARSEAEKETPETLRTGKIPDDPRTGKDEALTTAFEMLIAPTAPNRGE